MKKTLWNEFRTNPENSGYYLTYYPDTSGCKYFITQYNANRWCNPIELGHTGEPTHWCELPSPP